MAARAINSYDVGDDARLVCLFTDEDGAAVDPSAVTLKVKAPDGTVTTPSPVKVVAGEYYATVEITQAGAWVYRWESTGPRSADEHQFLARNTEF